MAPTKIAIIGAGLGGLAAALFLRARGVDVAVYEQNAVFQDVGAGIVVAPNMVRPLRRLGLGESLAAIAVKLDYAWEFRRWQDGRVIAVTPMRDACEQRYGAPCYVAHRADLRALFRRGLPEEIVHLDRRCVGLSQSRDKVALDICERDGGITRAEADAVIGADGIHSILRKFVVDEVAPRFRHLRVPLPRAGRARPGNGASRCAEMADRSGRHFVHYPISAGRHVNIVALAPAGDWRSESWTADGEIEDLLAEFESWDGRLHELIRSATQTKRWAVFDRAPLERWTVGRVALMGDAAHAMLPFLAQGAAQCVEDAETLRSGRRRHRRSIEAALHRYEALRLPRANQVLLGSRGREIRTICRTGPSR